MLILWAAAQPQRPQLPSILAVPMMAPLLESAQEVAEVWALQSLEIGDGLIKTESKPIVSAALAIQEGHRK